MERDIVVSTVFAEEWTNSMGRGVIFPAKIEKGSHGVVLLYDLVAPSVVIGAIVSAKKTLHAIFKICHHWAWLLSLVLKLMKKSRKKN